VVNLDDSQATYFLSFPAEEKYGYGLKPGKIEEGIKITRPDKYSVDKNGSRFIIKTREINLKMLGEFNLYNSLAALAVGLSQNINIEKIKTALEKVISLPGRLEFIEEGQAFKIIVDYAPEVESMKKLYEVVDMLEKKRIIHVLGSCGGGRDKDRRPVLGRIAGEKADVVIITNEDPYDEDPMAIINQVAAGAAEKGKVNENDLFMILDRRQAIEAAIKMVKPGDLVLITGKGAEQAICVKNGQKIPWDDRKAVREILAKIR
jgi:UDP-N-acetylmuramoyl-L-alanyl-D-glutamate--2,6-diaminopimelate ligase